MKNKMRKIHPGEIILTEYLIPFYFGYAGRPEDASEVYDLIKEIVLNKKRLTKKMAASLALLFGTTVKFWLNLQKQYDRSK